MKILICDDQIEFINETKSHVEEYMKSHFINYEIEVETNPQKILDNNSIYQLAFLDIQMEQVDGLSLAKVLKERNPKMIIFFILMVFIFNTYKVLAKEIIVNDILYNDEMKEPIEVEKVYRLSDKKYVVNNQYGSVILLYLISGIVVIGFILLFIYFLNI